MSFKLEGADKLTAQLKWLSQSVGGQIQANLDPAKELVENAIRTEAPQGPTGNLKRSVKSGGYKKRAGKPYAVFVTVDRKVAPHAHLVEFGSSRGQAANPFFARGVAKSKGRAGLLIAEAVQKAIPRSIK
jgi:HK97 gp10 family phage protein